MFRLSFTFLVLSLCFYSCGSDDPGSGQDVSTVDTGTPVEDAGAPVEDAGAPVEDAGTPVEDAGAPVEDAGAPVEDAGAPVEDAGTPVEDAGTPVEDAGTPVEDAGTPVEDAGTPVEDAGTPVEDAGTPSVDMSAAADTGTILVPAEVAGCSDGSREGFLSLGAYVDLAACGGAWDEPGIHYPGPSCDREAGNTGANPEGVGCNVEDLCSEGWHVCLGAADVHQRSAAGCNGIMEGAQSPAFFVARTSSIGSFFCAPDTIGDPQSENDLFGCGDLGCPTKQFVCEGNLSTNNQTKCDPDDPAACGTNGPCVESPCNPLTLGSHNMCKGIQKFNSNCVCSFLGELPPNDGAYVEGDMENVKCYPNSGGCGWCKPLNYWEKYLGEPLENDWSCGGNSTMEATFVVKSNPDRQGGVLCCRDFEE